MAHLIEDDFLEDGEELGIAGGEGQPCLHTKPVANIIAKCIGASSEMEYMLMNLNLFIGVVIFGSLFTTLFGNGSNFDPGWKYSTKVFVRIVVVQFLYPKNGVECALQNRSSILAQLVQMSTPPPGRQFHPSMVDQTVQSYARDVFQFELTEPYARKIVTRIVIDTVVQWNKIIKRNNATTDCSTLRRRRRSRKKNSKI